MTYRVLRRVAACFVLALAVAPAPAAAFCGFYVGGADAKLFNNATQVVLMREGTRTVLSMQNNYEGPPESFALVIPVPVVLQKENVKTLDRAVFAKVDRLAAPRLVEYWEQDPCQPFRTVEMAQPSAAAGTLLGASKGSDGALGVKVEARFSVGEYEIVILSARDSGGLERWLAQEKYAIPSGAEPLLRPYVQAGSKFFVAKVDPKRVKFEGGQAMLSPIRFHYDSEAFSLPVRLGLMNAKGPQDLIVHILAKGLRYEVANYPNVTIPTNIDVSERVSKDFGSFYAALLDKTLQRHPHAVVTEYSWDASTCDPCPGPALDGSDFATLGADVMASAVGGPQQRPGSGYAGYTITRLHARYTKDSLGDDLVFRSAPSIAGGREFMAANEQEGAPQRLEQGTQPGSGTSQFQGRYAVRHAWTGAISCTDPHRGRWGAPPDGSEPRPKPALNLAFASREPDQLVSFIRSDVAELGMLTGHAAGVPFAGPDRVPEPAPIPTPVTPAVSTSKGGCAGCATSPARAGSGWALAALAWCAAALRRRLG